VSFFTWHALLGKAPTADNLVKKNRPCDPCCALCYCLPENADHLLTECNFTEAVWDKVALHFQVHHAICQFQKGNVMDWIASIAVSCSRKEQCLNGGIVLSFWWHIWKERNRRVFDQKESSSLQVTTCGARTPASLTPTAPLMTMLTHIY
jgi:hypothetical protein